MSAGCIGMNEAKAADRGPTDLVGFNTLDRQVVQVWHRLRYHAPYIAQCRRWVRRFYTSYARQDGAPENKLTEVHAVRFARSYARRNGLQEAVVVRNARAAMSLWRSTIESLGVEVPSWKACPHPQNVSATLTKYRDWCKSSTGVKDSTLDVRCGHIARFLAMKSRQHASRCRSHIMATDIDKFVASCKPASVSGACTSMRSFLRFMHATGSAPTDISLLVGTVRPHIKTPPRALPWPDIRRILSAVDRRPPIGKRDYALMLLMASYGMGRGEVVGITLDDIDWHQRTLRVVRKKTGVVIALPLSSAVAKAIASYLRGGRPVSSERKVFLRAVAPCRPLGAWGVSTMVSRYAKTVGLSASAHVFRHSHACRHIEARTASPKVVSDILGHSNPESLSTYVRVARNRLRGLCLPLPAAL